MVGVKIAVGLASGILQAVRIKIIPMIAAVSSSGSRLMSPSDLGDGSIRLQFHYRRGTEKLQPLIPFNHGFLQVNSP